jgi:hypothetical protein
VLIQLDTAIWSHGLPAHLVAEVPPWSREDIKAAQHQLHESQMEPMLAAVNARKGCRGSGRIGVDGENCSEACWPALCSNWVICKTKRGVSADICAVLASIRYPRGLKSSNNCFKGRGCVKCEAWGVSASGAWPKPQHQRAKCPSRSSMSDSSSRTPPRQLDCREHGLSLHREAWASAHPG